MKIEEVLRKIRGLQNLADTKRGASPEEAATAAAKAQELMDKYNVDITDVDFDANQAKLDAEPVTDFGYKDPLDAPKRTYYEDNWSVRLASHVSEANGCKTQYSRTSKDFSTIRIVGRPTDVGAVRYLYAFFKQQILNLRAEHCKGSSSAYKGQFAMGCVDTLIEKLKASRLATFEEKRAEVASDNLALVRVNNAIARVDKKLEDIEDFENRHVYESLMRRLNITREQAKHLYGFEHDKLRAACSSTEEFDGIKERYDKYLDEQRKLYKGVKFSSGRAGFRGQGSAGESGREHGQRAGQAIRMTGAKAGLGSGSKQIN